MFERLRVLALEALGCAEDPLLHDRPDLVPIEGDVDGGWICLSRKGEVGFLDAKGRFDAQHTFAVPTTSIVGSLAQRVPLATWFIPKPTEAVSCPHCDGRGKVKDKAVARLVRCYCGGLGWIPK
jgi:hypothetical protein